MGNHGHQINDNIVNNWHQTAYQTNKLPISCNSIVQHHQTLQMGYQYYLIIKSNEQQEQSIYQYRKHSKSGHIINIQHFAIGKAYYQFQYIQKKQKIFRVITDYIQIKISQLENLLLEEALHILKGAIYGCCELVNHFGLFTITEKMIGLDNNGVVKVWINQNFSLNNPQHGKKPNNELQMLFVLVQILQQRIQNKKIPYNIKSNLLGKKHLITAAKQLQKQLQVYNNVYIGHCILNKQKKSQDFFNNTILQTSHGYQSDLGHSKSHHSDYKLNTISRQSYSKAYKQLNNNESLKFHQSFQHPTTPPLQITKYSHKTQINKPYNDNHRPSQSYANLFTRIQEINHSHDSIYQNKNKKKKYSFNQHSPMSRKKNSTEYKASQNSIYTRQKKSPSFLRQKHNNNSNKIPYKKNSGCQSFDEKHKKKFHNQFQYQQGNIAGKRLFPSQSCQNLSSHQIFDKKIDKSYNNPYKMAQQLSHMRNSSQYLQYSLSQLSKSTCKKIQDRNKEQLQKLKHTKSIDQIIVVDSNLEQTDSNIQTSQFLQKVNKAGLINLDQYKKRPLSNIEQQYLQCFMSNDQMTNNINQNDKSRLHIKKIISIEQLGQNRALAENKQTKNKQNKGFNNNFQIHKISKFSQQNKNKQKQNSEKLGLDQQDFKLLYNEFIQKQSANPIRQFSQQKNKNYFYK